MPVNLVILSSLENHLPKALAMMRYPVSCELRTVNGLHNKRLQTNNRQRFGADQSFCEMKHTARLHGLSRNIRNQESQRHHKRLGGCDLSSGIRRKFAST
jgi:hypothetical protein